MNPEPLREAFDLLPAEKGWRRLDRCEPGQQVVDATGETITVGLGHYDGGVVCVVGSRSVVLYGGLPVREVRR